MTTERTEPTNERSSMETTVMKWNDPALVTERRLVVRHFQRYSSEERARRGASHRLTEGQRRSVGGYFYTHPAVPNVAFSTRAQAAWAGLTARTSV
jgi:hypothetical protein